MTTTRLAENRVTGSSGEPLPEDQSILVAVEARRAELAHTDLMAKNLLHIANEDGLKLVALLIEARVMFSSLRERPGITMRQIDEFLDRMDEVIGL